MSTILKIMNMLLLRVHFSSHKKRVKANKCSKCIQCANGCKAKPVLKRLKSKPK